VALIKKEISAVIAGVSQQTPSKRSDGHVSEAINMSFTPVKGASSRPNTISNSINQLPIAGIPELVTPNTSHHVSRTTDESYIVTVLQHDAAGAPLTPATLQVIDSADGFEYSTSFDTDALDYLTTASTAPSTITCVTVNDTTFIANKDVITAMTPDPAPVPRKNEALITVHNVPFKTPLTSSSNPDVVGEGIEVRAYPRDTTHGSILFDGSNIEAFEKEKADESLTSVWSTTIPNEATHDQIAGHEWDVAPEGATLYDPILAATQNAYNPVDLIEAYRNGIAYNLNHRGYSKGRKQGLNLPSPSAAAPTVPPAPPGFHCRNTMDQVYSTIVMPLSQTTAASTNGTILPATEWPDNQHPGAFGASGGQWVQPPVDFDADTPSGIGALLGDSGFLPVLTPATPSARVHEADVIAGVSVHVGAMELLYVAKPAVMTHGVGGPMVELADANGNADTISMPWFIQFHNTPSAEDPASGSTDNTTWDPRIFYVTFKLVIEPDGADVNYYHYRSPMLTPGEFEQRLKHYPGARAHLPGGPEIRGAHTVDSEPTDDLGNKWVEVSNLNNTRRNDNDRQNPGTTPSATDLERSYHYFTIRPFIGELRWTNRMPDFIFYSPNVDLPAQGTVGANFTTSIPGAYRNSVTGTGGAAVWSPLVYGLGTPYGLLDSPPGRMDINSPLITSQDGGNLQFYNSGPGVVLDPSTLPHTPEVGNYYHYNYPAWEWVASGTDQIYGYSVTELFDRSNPAWDGPLSRTYPHPNFISDEAKRDSNLRIVGTPANNVSIITSEYGPITIADLPYRAPDGFLTRVIGDPASDGDEYYLKYDRKSESWIEDRTTTETHTFDTDTMPHILRRVIDGTAPRGIRFVFSAAAALKDSTLHADHPNPETSQWAERLVGDNKNAPLPSFIGYGISELFFYRDRLGFTSRGDLNLSETAEPLNFFRTSLQTVVDSDPIDITVSQTSGSGSVVDLFAAVSLNNGLMLFDHEQQFLLRSDDGQAFTHKTAHLSTLSSYPATLDKSPLYIGDRVLWMSEKGGSLRVWEFYPNAATTPYEDITQHIPSYIPTGGRSIIGSENNSMVVVRTDGAPESLFVYQYFYSKGEKLQQAWSRWDFSGKIIHAHFEKEYLKVILHRPNTNPNIVGYHMETINLVANRDLLDVEARLDHKLTFKAQLGEMVYQSQIDATTLTLASGQGFGQAAIATPGFVAVAGEGTGHEGDSLPITLISNTSVSVPGDQTGLNGTSGVVHIGRPYTQSLTLSPFYLRSDDRRLNTQINREGGRTQIKTISVSHSESRLVTAAITRQGVQTSQTIVPNSELSSGVSRFDVQSNHLNTDITISSDFEEWDEINNVLVVTPTWHPITITGLNFEVQYHERGRSLK